MTKKVQPILGGEGWLDNPAIAMARILKHAYVVDYSQSNITGGTVSIQKIMQQHGNEPDDLVSELATQLTRLYNTFYDGVEVTVNHDATDGSASDYGINISITATKDGESYDLSQRMIADKSLTKLRFENAFGE